MFCGTPAAAPYGTACASPAPDLFTSHTAGEGSAWGSWHGAKPNMTHKVAWVQSGGATVASASQSHPLKENNFHFCSSYANIKHGHAHSFLRNQ